MPNRQKYGLRIALRPSNAVEAVTFMDLAAIQGEIKVAREDQRDCKFDCVNALNDEPIAVLVNTDDIQIVMHHKWEPQPQRGQVQVPSGLKLS